MPPFIVIVDAAQEVMHKNTTEETIKSFGKYLNAIKGNKGTKKANNPQKKRQSSLRSELINAVGVSGMRAHGPIEG